MESAIEPTLFFSVYLHDALAESAKDPRRHVLQRVDDFVRSFELQQPSERRRYDRAVDIEFHPVKRRSTFELLFQAHSVYPKDRVGTYYECLVYACYEAVIVQVMITKFQDWQGSLLEGSQELIAALHSCFDENSVEASRDFVFGVSVIYWATAPSDGKSAQLAEEIRSICGEEGLQQTATDLGAPLWHSNRAIFPRSSDISQDFWVLITPRSAETEVNRRFYQLAGDVPAEFISVALARHKISYEKREYDLENQKMDAIGADLEKRVLDIVHLQRKLGPELDELLSHEAVGFQRKLAVAGTVLSDYRQSVSILKKLRRTFLINQRMYLIYSVSLVSERGKYSLANSIDQETAAAKFLANYDHEEIFAAELSRFQGIRNQANSDIDYAMSEIERHQASLQSAGEQLRIAGEREIGEAAHHLSVDSAAVVASITAVIATEMILKPIEEYPERAIAGWSLTIALILGSFAVTQMLSTGCSGKPMERRSLALALGCFAVFLVNRFAVALPTVPTIARFHLPEVVAFLVCGFGSLYVYRRISERRSRGSSEI